jgi:hypothetical protein
MNFTDSVIYYDEERQLYNFPFVVQFTNERKSIDFFFTKNDYHNQEEMSRHRIDYCSKELFRQITRYFESLQVICLDDSIEANNESVDRINGILSIIWNLFMTIKNIHISTDLTDSSMNLYDELLEMFLLMEDYYTIERKQELFEWKKKFMNLEK